MTRFCLTRRRWRGCWWRPSLEAAASIWTVAAIGLAVGGGLYFAAGLSTTIILAVLAGVKPLEEAYRDRNQTCQLVIETVRGTLTPEILKGALKVRNGQNTVVNLKGRLTNLSSGFIQGI